MPNWCEGMLKIRGKQEDVFNLLAENLTVWEFKFGGREFVDENAIEINRQDFEICVQKTAHINGTCRNFVEPNDINVWKGKDGNTCIAIEFKGAWSIESEPYVKLAKKYNISTPYNEMVKEIIEIIHIQQDINNAKKIVEKV